MTGWRPLLPAAAAGTTLTALGLLSLTVPAARTLPGNATGPHLAPPSARYPFGTTDTGLSVLDLVVFGAHRTLIIAALSTALALGVGTATGVLAGHFQGWPDRVLSRFTQWVLVLPQLPLAITIAAVLGPGLTQLSLAIALAYWPATARVVRAAVVATESLPHLERARALGAGHWRQIRVHTWPAVLPVVITCTTLTLGNALLSEATLSFFGLGDTTSVTWGGMLQDASGIGAITAGAWWYLLAPGLAITLIVMVCSIAGRSTEAALGRHQAHGLLLRRPRWRRSAAGEPAGPEPV
jgi:peptide/nickel transport system permease protein